MKGQATAVAEKLRVPKIQFAGEQDGPPERMLKERLAAAFVFHWQLKRAYLAQVQYADGRSVALCLRCPDGESPMLAEVVGEVFGSIFGSHEHLDILFISDSQEIELRRVCRPFYSVAGT